MTEDLLHADIPEKFKDAQTGAVKLDALLKSYQELERKFSQRPAVPKGPHDYAIDVSHGLFEIDPDVNARLHQCGCTQDQAQEVYNLAAEKLVPAIMQMKADMAADREVERLINYFGGADQWQDISRQLLAYGTKHLAPDVLESLSNSYEGVLALHRMMKSEEPSLKKDGVRNASALEEKDLQSLMRDPKYWRDKDPSTVAKVTEGFKRLYGGK